MSPFFCCVCNRRILDWAFAFSQGIFRTGKYLFHKTQPRQGIYLFLQIGISIPNFHIMIWRQSQDKVLSLSRHFKAVAIIGPRQSGKTTLARMCFPEKPYVSLETPQDRIFALEDPRQFLKQYPDGAIIDEVQRVPALLSWLQQLLDEDPQRGKFILTGSNNFLLLERITQTLAGRVAFVEQLPFSLSELQEIPGALADPNIAIWKGGYPPVQAEGIPPGDWYPAYLRTYVERDVRQIKNIENLLLFERMLMLCAGRIGQELNYSNLAVETGVDNKTIQSWLGILQASYIVWLLPPYFRNFNKRVVKSPKLYFVDTGLACSLLRISEPGMLVQHPYRGALFENFVLNELLKKRFNQGLRSNLYFWKEHAGKEIDVLMDEGLYQTPVEIKSGQTITADWLKGLQYWEQLNPDQRGGIVYYGGDEGQERTGGYAIRSWRKLAESAP
jgi:predicted AAA+ superfamily ATPase